jgi:hypothetical protein
VKGKLRSIVKVTRQASGKTWCVTLWVPSEDGRIHVLSKVLASDFELAKLAEQWAKSYRAGKVSAPAESPAPLESQFSGRPLGARPRVTTTKKGKS